VGLEELEELITEAWLCQASRPQVAAFEAGRVD